MAAPLSQAAEAAWKESDHWGDSQFANSSEYYARKEMLEKIILKDNPRASVIMEELAPKLLQLLNAPHPGNYAGD